MAHIRRRVMPSGKVRWQVIDKRAGKRVTVTCDTEREARTRRAAFENARPGSSAKFRALAEHYLARMEQLVEAGERERSYLDMLKLHINKHILSDAELAGTRCHAIGTPEVQLFLNRLTGKMAARSAAKIRTTLSQVFKHGARTGFVGSNPARDTAISQRSRPDAGSAAPFTLPAKSQLRALIDGAATFDATGRAQAVVQVLMFGGLRISELRGLPRHACNLVRDTPKLQIMQRADRYNAIGPVKSTAGRREVDLGPDTAQALRLWLIKAPLAPKPKGAAEASERPQYAFPNEAGGIWGYPNFRARFWVPLLNHCGLVTAEPADQHIRNFVAANSTLKAPLFGPHMLRHVYASLQIEQGVTPKRLQKLIGHATLKMTLDTYGHLWPDEDADRARARGVERMI